MLSIAESGVKKTRIQDWLVRAFFLAVAASLIFVIFFIERYRAVTMELEDSAAHLEQTMQLNHELRVASSEQTRLGRRLAVAANIDDFLKPFAQTSHRITDIQTKYLQLKIDPDERVIVQRIRSAQAEMTLMVYQIYQMLSEERSGESVRPLLESLDELEDELHDSFEALKFVQLNNLSEATTSLDRAMIDSLVGLLVFAGFLIALLIGLSYFYRQRILRPLNELVSAVQMVRDGDLKVRAPVRIEDEFGDLASHFNFMAETLESSYLDLERKVAERTERLQEVQQQLVQSEKMSAVGKLVSGVAHELNNPLTSIIGYAQILRDDLAQRKESGLVESIDVVLNESMRCTRIVESLLQFARQQKAEMLPMCLNDAVRRMVALRSYELRTRNIELKEDYHSDSLLVSADAAKIQQVVLNLVNNARDAIADSKRKGRIWVRTFRQEEFAVLEVCDNGTGILEPQRIFDPFYTTKPLGQGTGLGLSVCYGIVSEHGGMIQGENWEGGARFSMRLPIDPELAKAPQEDSALPAADPNFSAAPASPPRILIVDDENSLVRLQERSLRKLGFEVVGCASGEEAIAYLEINDVDLIVSDLRMPGSVNGLKLLDWVRQNREELQGRFLLISGGQLETGTGQLPIPADVPCLKKPFEISAYCRTVSEILQK